MNIEYKSLFDWFLYIQYKEKQSDIEEYLECCLHTNLPPGCKLYVIECYWMYIKRSEHVHDVAVYFSDSQNRKLAACIHA